MLRSRPERQSGATGKACLQVPALPGGWKATRAEVARSGDLAYLAGTYDLTVNDSSGKPVNDRGKYVAVWRKQADGKWRPSVNISNTDLPRSAPAGKKASAHHKKKK